MAPAEQRVRSDRMTRLCPCPTASNFSPPEAETTTARLHFSSLNSHLTTTPVATCASKFAICHFLLYPGSNSTFLKSPAGTPISNPLIQTLNSSSNCQLCRGASFPSRPCAQLRFLKHLSCSHIIPSLRLESFSSRSALPVWPEFPRNFRFHEDATAPV